MFVNLFGNRVFANVIKLREGHTGLGWALNPMTAVLSTRRGKFEHRDTLRESHVRMEAQIGVMCLTSLNVPLRIARASLVAQWLRICLLMQGTRVRVLVWEIPTCLGATGPVSHNC